MLPSRGLCSSWTHCILVVFLTRMLLFSVHWSLTVLYFPEVETLRTVLELEETYKISTSRHIAMAVHPLCLNPECLSQRALSLVSLCQGMGVSLCKPLSLSTLYFRFENMQPVTRPSKNLLLLASLAQSATIVFPSVSRPQEEWDCLRDPRETDWNA